MKGKNLIIKNCTKVIVLLLLIICIWSFTSVWAVDYSYEAGINAIVSATDPKNVLNKTIELSYSQLSTSPYLYCLEYGQMMDDAIYNIATYIEIDGETATRTYKSNGNWVQKSNKNQYNAILALILNSEGTLGQGPSSDGTPAQQAVWSYFPYWISKSGRELELNASWCSGNNWAAYDGQNNGGDCISKAQQAYTNGERANVRIYLLDSGVDCYQTLMISIPGGRRQIKPIVIEKVDTEDANKKLGGVSFIIQNENSQFLKATMENQTNNIYTIKDETVTESTSATVFRTGTTDNYKPITLKLLPDGKYKIIEVKNPNIGYEDNNVTKEFIQDSSTPSNVITIQIENKRAKDIKIEKVDEDTGEKIGGVEFKIRNDNNEYIIASKDEANNIYTVTGTTTDSNKATVFVTGTVDNYKPITIKLLKDGTYIIKEINNPNRGYEGNKNREWKIVKDAKNVSGNVHTMVVKNKITKPVTIDKVDKDTRATLGGVEFTLRNDKDEYIIASKDETNNTYTVTGTTTDSTKATKFVTGTTDNYKTITINSLPDGKYKLKEIYNPNEDYENNQDNEWDIIKNDGENQENYLKVEIENKRVKKLIIEKIDKTTGQKMGGVEFIIWNDNKEFIQANKVDEANNIYEVIGTTTDGNKATRFVTGTVDNYKPITIKLLPESTYTIKEIYNPYEGYEINQMQEWIKVKDDKIAEEYHIITLENEKGPVQEEPKSTTVSGKITISGFVWEDIAEGKSNQINSQYDSNEQKVEGIKVYWKDKEGNVIDSATTDENGQYTFSMEIQLKNHSNEIMDETNTAKYERVNTSYVEFDYNGIKYTTVANASDITKENVSQGIEIDSDRNNIDSKFDMVTNKQIIDNGNAIENINSVKGDLTEANYLEKYAVTATTNKITNLLKIAEAQTGWTEKTTFCIDHCKAGFRQHEIGRINLSKNGASATVVLYCHGGATIENWNDVNGVLDSEIEKYLKAPIGEEFNQYEGIHYYSANETNGPTTQDCLNGKEQAFIWNIKNVNLGLVRKEQPDAAITSDIEKVRVIMKNQEYTYIYGNRGIQNNEELFDYKVKFGDKYMETYSRPVNPADIAYVNYNNTDDLKVYVTYNIILKNQSNTLQMGINEIVNYYDSNYTIYTGPGTSTTSGWKDAEGTNNGYKIAYNTSLSGTKLQPGTRSEVIKIEFEVNQDRIKGLLNEDATLCNVSEIFSYTTYYGENTICAERKTAVTKGKVDQQYAGLDIDSIPGNAIPGNVDTYEDDTDKAPSFLLKKDPNYKIMSGIVYEDSQTAESKTNKERLGNGRKDEKEKGIANVKVELLDANTGEPAYLYYKDTSSGTANKKLAITYTDANGNYTLGNETESGVVVGNYIIKYTYGNDITVLTNGATTIDGGKTFINARNYKSTIITEPNVKNVMQGNNSDKWYLNMDSNVDSSIAVDDLKERLTINSLKYDNYSNAVNMSAYTKTLNVQIEYTKDQVANVDQNGGEFAHNCSVFDFGIMERAREDIVINKTISKIKITLANGQVLLEGDPRIDNMNYVKALGFKKNTDSSGREIAKVSTLDKMLTVEMDSELIQGATLEVWYSVIATNNSEIDYDYESTYNDINRTTEFITKESQANYYYYGDKNGLRIITNSAEIVVDYMNPKLVCNVGKDFTQNLEGVNNAEWFRYDNVGTEIDADYLKNNGYISYKINAEEQDETYETIKNRKQQIMATNVFANLEPAGGTKTSVIYTSGLLANQDENNLFDNHVEIIQINGKIGRTINSVQDNTREQVAKTYQPGNYIPALDGEHQQDDDRVRIVITPPTGIMNYTTTYIVAVAVGLIVILGGIFLIKKNYNKK